MFFVASASIAADHPDLKAEVEALDTYLEVNLGHRVRVGHAAGILQVDRDLVRRLLDAHVRKGTVTREPAYICPVCDAFLERVPGEGDLWCDVCERTFTYRGSEAIGEKVYRPLVSAERAAPLDGGCPVRQPPEAPPGPVVIQFIGGDRGGGPKAQVQIPREQKAISDAVRLGVRAAAFEFAPAIHAASVDDVIACHRERPTIIHIVGHGEDRAMVLVRDRELLVDYVTLGPEQAETLFGNFPTRVRLIVFNACKSLALARHLTERGVAEMAIGVEGLLPDDQAVRFARAFYRQLADGLSVRSAFDLSCLHLGNLDGAARPQLFHAPGVEPGRVVFAPGDAV